MSEDRPGRARRTGMGSPLYQQVYAQLRNQLAEGRHDPGRPLPSEPELGRIFGVSRITIRRTLQALESEGLIRRVRGSGTYPVPRPGGPERQNISGHLDNLISYDSTTTARTLSRGLVMAQGALAEAFGPGDCLRIERLRHHGGQPISFTVLHVPARLARPLQAEPDSGEPVVLTLERHGVIAERTEQALTAAPAAPRVAGLLGVAEGAPLISMRRMMLDANGRPMLHQESLYAPDRFEYRMILTRTRTGSTARWTPIA